MLVILFCSKRRLVEPFFVGRFSLDVKVFAFVMG